MYMGVQGQRLILIVAYFLVKREAKTRDKVTNMIRGAEIGVTTISIAAGDTVSNLEINNLRGSQEMKGQECRIESRN